MICSPMDEQMLRAQLAWTDERILVGERHLKNQLAFLAQLTFAGLDFTEAKALLASYEPIQGLLFAYRKTFIDELQKAPPSET